MNHQTTWQQQEIPFPKYFKLRLLLEEYITKNRLKKGDIFLSQRQIAKDYKVSLSVVRQCLAELEKNKIIQRWHGKGTFILDPPKTTKKSLMRKSKLSATITILSFLPEYILTKGPYYTRLMKGIQDEIQKAGFKAAVEYKSKEDISRVDFKIEPTAGLLVVGLEDNLPVYSLIRQNVPLVFVDYYAEDSIVSCIAPDNKRGTYEAVRCLLERGHTRIGFINSTDPLPNFRLRLEGYRQALIGAGINCSSRLIKKGDDRTNGGYVLMKELLGGVERPTAVVCATDNLAVSAMHAIREEGVRIPEDISIIGFGNLIPAIDKIGLASVEIHIEELGRLSVSKLRNLMNDDPHEPSATLSKADIIIRESIGKIPY